VGVYVKCVRVGGLDPKKGERGTMGWWKVNYVLPVLRASSLTLLLWQGVRAGAALAPVRDGTHLMCRPMSLIRVSSRCA